MSFRLQALSESCGLARSITNAGRPERAMTMKNPEARHRSEDRTSSTDCLRLEYEEYLRNQRGLSERTIYHCWRLANRFLQFRFNGDSRDLSTISCDDIARFMQHLTSGRKPFRDKTPPTHLRNFFRFAAVRREDILGRCYRRGWCDWRNASNRKIKLITASYRIALQTRTYGRRCRDPRFEICYR
jgi:hypothetical protein